MKNLLLTIFLLFVPTLALAQTTVVTDNTTVTTNTNNNVQSGTVTNNNNNVNTSTSVSTNNNVMSGSVTYNNNNVNNNTNNNTVTSTGTNTNYNYGDTTSTNNNTSHNTNVNDSKSVSSVTSNNVNDNRNYNDSKVEQTVKSPPPSAMAPSIMSYSQDLCLSGVSGAVQTQIIGVSGGKPVRDMNCERLKLSKTLYDMGMKVAAVSMMCQDERVFKAMEMAGTPCPFMGKIGEEAKTSWDKNKKQRPDYKPTVSDWFSGWF